MLQLFKAFLLQQKKKTETENVMLHLFVWGCTPPPVRRRSPANGVRSRVLQQALVKAVLHSRQRELVGVVDEGVLQVTCHLIHGPVCLHVRESDYTL